MNLLGEPYILKCSLFYFIKPTKNYIYVYIYMHIVSIVLYGYTSWALTKRMEKKLDGNYTRTLQAILNKSWK